MAQKRKQQDTDPKVLFGQKVRTLRHEKGWSQMELSFQCGLDRTYVGGVERGERNIALVNICKLADALGVEPSQLLNFSD